MTKIMETQSKCHRGGFFAVLLLLITGMTLTSAHGQSDAIVNAIQSGTGHRFAATDYSGQKVFIVDADGKVEWEYEKAGSCNDLWVLPNNNLLFNTGRGVIEVTPDKEVVFEYKSKSEIYACQRLANGNTFIGECSSGKLLEVTPDGKIAFELRLLPKGKDGGHLYMRNARKLDNGNYLVTHYQQQLVKEYAPDGKVVQKFKAPGGPHSAARLPNGNTLIACADMQHNAKLIEVNPKGETVWAVTSDDLPGITLWFLTGFHRLPNGKTVLSNWLGHGHFGEAPHIIEVTPNKEVVWTFQDHKTMKTISSVQMLDVQGDPIQGQVFH